MTMPPTTAMLPLTDPTYAQRQAANPGASVWVAASAGSGKTKVLVDRVLHLLLKDVRPERILCLTFTRAAAAEVANRINQRLSQWATLPAPMLAADLTYLQGNPPDAAMKAQARRLFAHVLDVGIRIETLHAFCQALLKRFPLEAGVAPHFQVMDEHAAAESMAAAWDQTLLTACNKTNLTRAVALETVTALVHEVHFPELMDELVTARSRLQRLLDRWNGVDGVIAAVRARLGVTANETPSHVLATACTGCDAPALRVAAVALQTGSKTDIERGKILATWLAEQAHRAETFDDYWKVFCTGKGTVRKTLITREAAKAAPMATKTLAAEAERLVQVQARRKAAAVAEATTALLHLWADLLAAYRNYKDTRALLDYEDLIFMTCRLLETEGQTAWVLYKLDDGLDHILIDEAQDISAEQWLIVERLTQEFFAGLGSRTDHQAEVVRTVFAVGDRKQSIYSFQGAAPEHFESMRSLLRDQVTAVGQMWADVPLNISFRSTPAVLQAVDAVFMRDTAREGVALSGETIKHIAFRDGQAGLVEIWPLIEPEKISTIVPWQPKTFNFHKETSMLRLSRLVAHQIAAMVSGYDWLESRQRPVQAGDIMVLVRRRSGFVEALVRALKSLNVPVSGVDRMILREQIAIMDLTALGNVLLLPEDDLTLAAVLKSPLIGLDEEQLFTLAHPRESCTLWQALQNYAGSATPFGYACDWLTRLLTEVDYRRPYELYTHVLGALGGRRRLIARLGPDAEDAIDEFLTLSLHYEMYHVPSLQGFLQWLQTTTVEAKRDLEQTGAEAVRILTVHGAKGLQAPVVFLPDSVQIPTRIPHTLWEDSEEGLVFWQPHRALKNHFGSSLRDMAERARDREYHRLLYVAMTRAEDRLYVCGWQTYQLPPAACWYNLIHTALAPLGRREINATLAASGLLPSAEVLRFASVQAEATGKTVEERFSESVKPLPLPQWAKTAPPIEPMPPRPLVPSQPNDKEPPASSPLEEEQEEEQKGMRLHRGRLVHKLLQSLPSIPAEERSATAQRYLDHAAAALLSPAARVALVADVQSIICHPELLLLFGPNSQEEVPVVGRVGAHVISGQIDRLVVTEEVIIIADYKTHRTPPESLHEIPVVYRQQMAAYRSVLAAIYPGRRVDCVLVWTDGPQITLLPAALLNPFTPS
ncbi:FIG061771: ATP-dependent nuclease subunit A [invertebrate metagenome]|uniref:DNA 3'-5' helicase n=1 Tax=invertebrate metagenome TaxID=1711999 RepID=A0A484H679_9ZZZZ